MADDTTGLPTPDTIQRALRMLRYAPRITPDERAARLHRELSVLRERPPETRTPYERAFRRDNWLQKYLVQSVGPATHLTANLVAILLTFLDPDQRRVAVRGMGTALMDPGEKEDAGSPAPNENAMDILRLLLNTPSYVRHLSDFDVAYEAALVRGDTTTALVLLYNAPGLLERVLDPAYRSMPGQRFANRVMRREANELSSGSVPPRPREDGSSDRSSGDLALLVDLMSNSERPDDADESPLSSWSEPHAWQSPVSWDTILRWEEEEKAARQAERDALSSRPEPDVSPTDTAPFFHWRNIDDSVTSETAYRRVVFTTPTLQFVQQRLAPAPAAESEVPWETHDNGTQFFRTEAGAGYAEIERPEDGTIVRTHLPAEAAVMIQPGVRHRLVNVSTREPWFFYSLYAPPEH